MGRLRLVPYRKLRGVAEGRGFRLVRRVGSHCTFERADGKTVTIPDHGSQVLLRPLLRKLIGDLGLTVDEYNQLLDEL